MTEAGAPPIIVGFDSSDGANAALRWAMDEGARTNTPLALVFAFDWPVMAGADFAPAIWPDYGAREEADEVVAAALARVRQSHPDVSVTGGVVPGAATAALVDRSQRARLVVVGGRGAGGFTDQLIGSTAVAVSTHARCPVVVVRGQEPPAGAPVVVGFDGSDYAQMAVEFAFAEAASRDASLRVIRSAELPARRWRPQAFDLDAHVDAEKAETTELISGWRDKYPQVSTSVDIVPAPPAEALVEASTGAQLVVVGSRGRGGFRGLLLGSVSQQLLYHAACPVAIVRTLPA